MSALAPRRLAPWSEKLASPRTCRPGNGAHQVVVHPQAAHRVVDGRVDPHRHLVRIFVGDLLVHVEEVAVLLWITSSPSALDGVGEVQVHRQAALADATPVVADLLGVARRDVARHEVAEARVLAFEVVVALVLGDLFGRPRVALRLRHPDAAVVAQALAHQRQLRLMVAADRDAGRVNLREARIGEERAALVRAPGGRDVASSWRWSRGSRPCRSRRWRGCTASPA